MSKQTGSLDLGAVILDSFAQTPLHLQLYDSIRIAILANRLKRGTRLPSTRTMASDLSVSRNTVMSAFDQLLAEGYIESRVGDGTYVSEKLPDEWMRVRKPTAFNRSLSSTSNKPIALKAPRLSRLYKRIEDSPNSSCDCSITPRAFRMGLPAIDVFPTQLWLRLNARRMRKATSELLSYGNTAGYRPLREAIAEYLGSARGVQCSPNQVFITAASQDALNFSAQMLLNPNDEVWMEDAGYQGARIALMNVGVNIVPIPVDDDGMQVEVGLSKAPRARMAYVTPSHQYPRGVTLSLSRRLALLDWAKREDAWILEDDFNSEYRYCGRPLASLQGLDTANRVIYIGTFSKVLFPSLRIGYLVAPPQLVDAFAEARTRMHHFVSMLDQATLTDFIVEGHFARHIRRMRELYSDRRSYLIHQLFVEFGDFLRVGGADAGLHLMTWLPNGVDDVAVSKAIESRGVEAKSLSSYSLLTPARGGLVLGYGALNERNIRDGVRKMYEAVRTFRI
jgi:GntR family transcriptional regulator/MocR family aminotransferase